MALVLDNSELVVIKRDYDDPVSISEEDASIRLTLEGTAGIVRGTKNDAGDLVIILSLNLPDGRKRLQKITIDRIMAVKEESFDLDSGPIGDMVVKDNLIVISQPDE
jgi:hypothetical protein